MAIFNNNDNHRNGNNKNNSNNNNSRNVFYTYVCRVYVYINKYSYAYFVRRDRSSQWR